MDRCLHPASGESVDKMTERNQTVYAGGETYPQRREGGMNGPRRVQPAGAGCPQAPVRPRVPALNSRAQGRTPMRPWAGATAFRSSAPCVFSARRQGPVAGRVFLPATGAYGSRSAGSRWLSNPVGIHLNFALGLSNEVGPPQGSGEIRGTCHSGSKELAPYRKVSQCRWQVPERVSTAYSIGRTNLRLRGVLPFVPLRPAGSRPNAGDWEC